LNSDLAFLNLRNNSKYILNINKSTYNFEYFFSHRVGISNVQNTFDKKKNQAMESFEGCTSRYFWPPWNEIDGLNYSVTMPIAEELYHI
jgi:hypothetical protein